MENPADRALVISAPDFAAYRSVTTRTVHLWIAKGLVPAIRLGRDWYLDLRDPAVKSFKPAPRGRRWPKREQPKEEGQ